MTTTYSKPTTNYASGRALLHEYDADHNGSISMSELMKAIGDHKAGKITKEEVDYVTSCWKFGAGGIDKMSRVPGPVPEPVPGPVPEPVPGPVTPAANRLSYEDAIDRMNAGLQVYVKFDIPLLDLIPGIPWGPGMPILPGFALKTEP